LLSSVHSPPVHSPPLSNAPLSNTRFARADSAAAISDLTESLKSPSSYIPTLTISPLPAFPATLNAATLPVCTVYLDLPSILLDVLDYEFSSTLYLNHRPTVLATKFMEIVHSHLLETFSTARLNAAESNHGVSIILPANKKGSGAANGCTKVRNFPL